MRRLINLQRIAFLQTEYISTDCAGQIDSDGPKTRDLLVSSFVSSIKSRKKVAHVQVARSNALKCVDKYLQSRPSLSTAS